MQHLTEPEVLEKWSRIAMKIFPPQTEIRPASSARRHVIQVRWKAENNPQVLSAHARGVDLCFPPEMMAAYLSAATEIQLKHDAFIESAISERLKHFAPYNNSAAKPQVESWLISSAAPSNG